MNWFKRQMFNFFADKSELNYIRTALDAVGITYEYNEDPEYNDTSILVEDRYLVFDKDGKVIRNTPNYDQTDLKKFLHMLHKGGTIPQIDFSRNAVSIGMMDFFFTAEGEIASVHLSSTRMAAASNRTGDSDVSVPVDASKPEDQI